MHAHHAAQAARKFAPKFFFGDMASPPRSSQLSDMVPPDRIAVLAAESRAAKDAALGLEAPPPVSISDEPDDEPEDLSDDGAGSSVEHAWLSDKVHSPLKMGSPSIDPDGDKQVRGKITAADRKLRQETRGDRSIKWVFHQFDVRCGEQLCPAVILQRRAARPSIEHAWASEELGSSSGADAVADGEHSAQSLSTQQHAAEHVSVAAAYSLLSYLLPHRSKYLCARRVVELGAGLGLVSSVVQQLHPRPQRLVATEATAASLTRLRQNIDANPRSSDSQSTEVALLNWMSGIPPPKLAGSFDLVVIADPNLLVSTNSGESPAKAAGAGAMMEHRLRRLFDTAAALLDPFASEPPARLVFSVEPWEAYGQDVDPLRTLVPAAAEAAGLRCLQWSERKVNGTKRPEWAADVIVFERASADLQRAANFLEELTAWKSLRVS